MSSTADESSIKGNATAAVNVRHQEEPLYERTDLAEKKKPASSLVRAMMLMFHSSLSLGSLGGSIWTITCMGGMEAFLQVYE